MILVVDDDEALGAVLVALLTQDGMPATHLSDPTRALDYIEEHPVDVVLTDLRMPKISGMQLIDQLQERFPMIPVVMLTAHGSVPTAVEAMKRGASDFLLKPFDRDEVRRVMQRALLLSEANGDRVETAAPSTVLIGESQKMASLRCLVSTAGASRSTVLVLGESGTGKELVARELHREGLNPDEPFVAVNCAALPGPLLESELFGHARGAFTGATMAKPGRIELAGKGTLFLDEIGELPLPLQPKLLRLLQEREYSPVGSPKVVKTEARFVAATNRDLVAMVEAGTFREDLYYRLKVIEVTAPPLKDRGEDCLLLARMFADRYGETGVSVYFDDGGARWLRAQAWPGNVRELENLLQRLSVLHPGERITSSILDAGAGTESPTQGHLVQGRLSEQRDDAERAALVDALKAVQGNRTKAAKLLGISRRTLYNKMERLEVE